MRISDWSSDVCSSDLAALQPHPQCPIIGMEELCVVAAIRPADFPADGLRHGLYRRPVAAADAVFQRLQFAHAIGEIGRASCREGVCQYVKISVVAGSVKKEKIVMKTMKNMYKK